jgi:hypothetical protein
MSKKDIQQGASFLPTAVGKTVYVWSSRGNKPTGNDTCVISAHGVQALVTSAAKAPQVTLFFYCPNGWILSDPGLDGIARGITKYNEKFAAGNAPQDYELSKYQGRHSTANETYGKIQSDIHAAAHKDALAEFFNKEMERLDSQVAKWGQEGVAASKASIRTQYEKDIAAVKDVIRDVVTIRHRKMYKSPTLFDVIQMLENAGFHYKEVHCSFCRGPAQGAELGKWQPSGNTSPV